MCFNLLVQKDVAEKQRCSWAFSVCSTGNGLVVQNKIVCTSSGSPIAKAHTTSRCYLASPLWDVQTFSSSPIQEFYGRRNKVEEEVISQDEKQREIPSTSKLKSHYLCLAFPSQNMIHKNHLCPHV